MSEDKKRDRALQRRVRERQAKTGESYQAAWQQLTDQEDPKFTRYPTGLNPLDEVLGGGLVSASVVLLTGPAGSGKTTLTLQMLKGLGHQCLHVTVEDTLETVAANAKRVGAVTSKIHVTGERRLVQILEHASKIKAQTIAIDSIQKIVCDDLDDRAGSKEQLQACADRLIDYAKTTSTTIWLVGDDAAPFAITASVDVVLKIECGAYFEGRERIVSCEDKNRFGPMSAVGCFELTAHGFVAIDGSEVPAPPVQKQSRVPSLGRLLLPFSRGAKVLPGQSAQITAHSQVLAFWPDRLLIKHADRWDVRRLAVGMGKSPWCSLIEDEHRRRRASVFSLDTYHPLISREVPGGEPIVLVVNYIGTNEQGESFEATLFGCDGRPPAKSSDHGKTTEASDAPRISQRAESKSVSPNEMAILPITLESPALFVDRFTIADAEDWIVHDIRVREISIFLQNGDLPGEMFTGSVPVILEPLVAKDLVEIAATYVGKKATACLKVELSGQAKPSSIDREVSYFLPLSTDVPILPTQSAQITARPMRDFQPDRVVIADPDAWIVNDIKVGNRAQTVQSGDLPGQTFSIHAVGCDVTLDPVRNRVDFAIVVSRGENQEDAGFFCGVQGRLVQER